MGKIAYITVIPQVFEMIDGVHMVPVAFNTQKIRTKIVVESDEDLEKKLAEIREKVESYGTST
jgi:translation elongation factor EF-1beta